jgi:3-ketosteroid 9alpha-monooxygenase subunit A
MPPPYPNGWFFVMLSHELKKGDVKTVRMFGQDVVAFRAMDGTAAVVDPFCAHLGAHLGEGRNFPRQALRTQN